MKAFIDRIFKARKEKKESIQDQATQAAVEAIVQEVKQEIKKEKPNHIDCECKECLNWRKNNAK